jgi:hypothetical protein
VFGEFFIFLKEPCYDKPYGIISPHFVSDSDYEDPEVA